MIEREKQARKSGQRKSQPKERTAMLISQIHDSFENLSFIEQKQIYSYEQINNTVKNLWNQYNACLTKISEAEGMIERLESVSNAPKMLFEIRARMESNKENPEYLVEQYHEDLKLAKSCADAIQKYQLKDKDSVVALQEKVEKYKEQVQRCRMSLPHSEVNFLLTTVVFLPLKESTVNRAIPLKLSLLIIIKSPEKQRKKQVKRAGEKQEERV